MPALSDEGLSARMDANEIHQIRQLLALRCEHIEVVVYLRPQHERRIGGNSQHLRSGSTSTGVLARDGADNWGMYYDKILDAWACPYGSAHTPDAPNTLEYHLLFKVRSFETI